MGQKNSLPERPWNEEETEEERQQQLYMDAVSYFKSIGCGDVVHILENFVNFRKLMPLHLSTKSGSFFIPGYVYDVTLQAKLGILVTKIVIEPIMRLYVGRETPHIDVRVDLVENCWKFGGIYRVYCDIPKMKDATVVANEIHDSKE